MKTVIFARVSTNIQEYDRQVNELTALANSKGWSEVLDLIYQQTNELRVGKKENGEN